jgi:type IV pilus assembly protein PilV
MSKSQTQQRGFSLLEMLVALVIFSIGLLAVAGLQTVSKQTNFEGLQRTAASQIANGLLEDIRMNGDAINIYRTAATLGSGSTGGEPMPSCGLGAECNATQKAAHDLWFWEQVLDGNMETSAGLGTGGLMFPSLCIDGPAVGGPGIYRVTIAWRGSVSLVNSVNNPCGAGNPNYGNENEFRRILQIPTYIDPNF